MSTRPRHRPSVGQDERGAIMVMGIFMCTCLVGALWYIAGIGDAVVYRERLQEAADATAMTTAVLHARGLNIIVMVNLAMAAILAIRVALKVLQVALAFATVIVAGCALIPLPFNPAEPICAVAAPLLGEADELLQQVIADVDPIIDDILISLHYAADGLLHLIPFTSVGGGAVLGQKYKPFIQETLAIPPLAGASGLPLEDGSTGRLCSEAGTVVMDLVKEILPGVARPVIGFINPLFQEIINEGGEYFCELGGGTAPTFDSLTQRQAKKRCDMEFDQKVDDMRTADDTWKKQCSTMHLTCYDRDDIAYQTRFGQSQSDIADDDVLRALEKSKKPEDKAALTNVRDLQATYEAKYSDVQTFKSQMNKCRQDTEKQIKDKLAKTQRATGNGNDKTPQKVKSDWKNGVANGQILSQAKVDESTGSLLNIGPKAVRIGALKDPRATAMNAPLAHDYAYAQAEFFYDCAGAWDGDDCNGKPRPDLQQTKDNEEAMWHLRWRARLRRYNAPPCEPIQTAVMVNDMAGLGRLGAAEARTSFSGQSLLNLELRRELVQTDPKEVELH